jgi:hypothetical protein
MLTNIVIQKVLPREKDYKLSDSAGLYLFDLALVKRRP